MSEAANEDLTVGDWVTEAWGRAQEMTGAKNPEFKDLFIATIVKFDEGLTAGRFPFLEQGQSEEMHKAFRSFFVSELKLKRMVE